MKNKSLMKDYILLVVLTLIIILLIILFSIVTYAKPGGKLFSLPSLGLWKPLEDIAKKTNLSANESLIEKNRQIENPSNIELIKTTFKQYWISYVVLFLIVLLIVAWILIVFRVYNG